MQIKRKPTAWIVAGGIFAWQMVLQPIWNLNVEKVAEHLGLDAGLVGHGPVNQLSRFFDGLPNSFLTGFAIAALIFAYWEAFPRLIKSIGSWFGAMGDALAARQTAVLEFTAPSELVRVESGTAVISFKVRNTSRRKLVNCKLVLKQVINGDGFPEKIASSTLVDSGDEFVLLRHEEKVIRLVSIDVDEGFAGLTFKLHDERAQGGSTCYATVKFSINFYANGHMYPYLVVVSRSETAPNHPIPRFEGKAVNLRLEKRAEQKAHRRLTKQYAARKK